MRERYPAAASARDRFVVERRGPRNAHDPWRHQGVIVEDERSEDGSVARVATVFLTGRECPWRCVMCDLWRYTIEEDTPVGAIPMQIAAAWIEAARTDAVRTDVMQPDVMQPAVVRTEAAWVEAARQAHADGADAAGGAGGRSGRISAMKLYNAGSFFDPRAVPESDYDEIAAQLVGLERVIVESHPALIGARVDRFLDALERQWANPGRGRARRSEVAPPRLERRAARDDRQPGGAERSEHGQSDRPPAPVPPRPRLEVAMGLETAHPVALERLHKRITLERFAQAAADLRRRDVALRVFLLIAPPFIPSDEQVAWLLRSIDFAFECGASVVSLVPTRSGNGAMEALHDEGLFRQPALDDIERSFATALAHTSQSGFRGRVFVDLWELQRFASAEARDADLAALRARLGTMNLEQGVLADTGMGQAAPVAVARARGEVAS